MRFVNSDYETKTEGDWTSMIDITFLLVAFFMVLINFSEAEQDQRIRLPSSQLAKPPDVPFDEPRTLQLTKQGTVLFGGDEVPIAGLDALLLRDAQVLERDPNKQPSMVTVIIRADGDAPAGQVQELIKMCQNRKFEKFVLRAKQETP